MQYAAGNGALQRRGLKRRITSVKKRMGGGQ